jgi:hypothetical protein
VQFADENLRAGFHPRVLPRSPINMPDCWTPIVKRAKAEPNTTMTRIHFMRIIFHLENRIEVVSKVQSNEVIMKVTKSIDFGI